MHTHSRTCCATVGDTLRNDQALVDTLADTVPEMEEKSPGDTQGGAQALLDTRPDKVEQLEAVTPGDTLGDARALVDTLADTVQEMEEYLVVDKRVGTQALMTQRLRRLQRWRR